MPSSARGCSRRCACSSTSCSRASWRSASSSPLPTGWRRLFAGGFLEGYEDFIALLLLFAGSLMLLRLDHEQAGTGDARLRRQRAVRRGRRLGLISGYLLAGFLICAMQTLPWHENFLDFQPRTQRRHRPAQHLPPDRVWLAMMRYAGAHPLAWEEDDPGAESNYDRYVTFDRHATFELRDPRYRRHDKDGMIREYKHELDREIKRDAIVYWPSF